MSIYKENEVILSKDNKVFIVTKYIGLQCASCVFSKRFNTTYDDIDNCAMRKKHYINTTDFCETLLPYGCTFKEFKGGI